MELSQLRYFIAVAKLGNMSKAAETLFVSPAQSEHQHLPVGGGGGRPLFERRRGQDRPQSERRAAAEKRGAGRFTPGRRRPGCAEPTQRTARALSIVCMTDDTTLLEHFLLEHPEVNLIHQRADLPNVTSLLDRCEVDLAMTVLLPPSEEVVYERIYACNFGMLMRREHPLAAPACGSPPGAGRGTPGHRRLPGQQGDLLRRGEQQVRPDSHHRLRRTAPGPSHLPGGVQQLCLHCPRRQVQGVSLQGKHPDLVFRGMPTARPPPTGASPITSAVLDGAGPVLPRLCPELLHLHRHRYADAQEPSAG